MHILWILMVLFLVACSVGTQTAVPKSEAITCTAAYRTSVEQGIEREETLTFTDRDAEQSVAFADMVLHAAYRTGELDNERTLRVWVTDAAETAGGAPAVFHAHLYQLSPTSGPQNQFQGGHGFTGLTYSYHPSSAAELQFWCAVK